MHRKRSYLALFTTSSLLLSLFASFSSTEVVRASIGGRSPVTSTIRTSHCATDQFLTSISTDKPIYRSGETVYGRGVLLNAENHKPLDERRRALPVIQISGPKGDVVYSNQTYTNESTWPLAWTVPDGMPGGEYILSVTYPQEGYATSERKFEIRSFRAPRLNSQITFLRDGYGPGEKVTATLEVKRAEGGIPEGAKVTVSPRVDGITLEAASAKIGPKGLCTVSFDLPAHIKRGEGTLALTIEDGGVIENASKTIPILLNTLDLEMFPEGGDLIAGFKNRVYLQAHQLNGKPADVVAEVVSDDGNGQKTFVVGVKTEHEGRGRFEFVPAANRQYFLKVLKPTGIAREYALPKVKAKGVVIRATKNVYGRREPITLGIGSLLNQFSVTISKRDKQLTSCTMELNRKGNSNLVLCTVPVDADADGVLTVTVLDESGAPLAERLIFREPAKNINIAIKPDKATYAPGDTVKVNLKSTDDTGKPISAVLGLCVTDESVLKMVEKRERAPRLPVMVFLEPEVQDLADADVYLDSTNPKAPLATDLLLGTQGWRRFVLLNSDKLEQSQSKAPKDPVSLQNEIMGKAVNDLKARLGEPLKNPHPLSLPAEIGRVEAPRDVNLFQVEPSVIDERHYTSGRTERWQKTLGQLSSVDRYTFFCGGQPVAVREFAHQDRSGRKPSDRSDFSETLYWNAGLRTNAQGEGNVSFSLSDNITSFQVAADAFSDSGALGAATGSLKAVQPFYAEAKLPLEVTAGDQIMLPVSLINGTTEALKNVIINLNLPTILKLFPAVNPTKELKPEERARNLEDIHVGFASGLFDVVLDAKAGPYEDKVTRKLSVKSQGFPAEKSFGGQIDSDKSIKVKIKIDKDVVTDSLLATTSVFPSPVANLTSALERLIQEPNGCFEQTSSTTYPLTMAQQYFLSHSNVDPKMVASSRDKLERGYKRLVGFWCPDRGFEWFGQNPGHEALTAYGLLHFTDMTKVINVDQNMIATTRAWLMKQKDGKGGFTRNRRAPESWIEDKACSDAYIIWALLESGQPATDLKFELATLKKVADESRNNYVVALAANAFFISGDKLEAKKLMQRLADMQQSDGHVNGVEKSIVGSGGESLQVEGTALATLAWLRDSDFTSNVDKSIRFLAASCKAGRYGSTQATVLALRSIVAYDQMRSGDRKPGKLRLYLDGQLIGDSIAFDGTTQEAVKFPNLSERLTPGEHDLEIQMTDGFRMPYSVAVKYNRLTPDSDKDSKVDLSVHLTQDKLVEGETTEADVTVTNLSQEPVPTPVVIVGLPGGLEPRHDQLKELVKRKVIASYELLGREVVLYWRSLPGKAKVEVPLSLVAAVPGDYTAPASRAYLYYTDEFKKWVDGVHVRIQPKN